MRKIELGAVLVVFVVDSLMKQEGVLNALVIS